MGSLDLQALISKMFRLEFAPKDGKLASNQGILGSGEDDIIDITGTGFVFGEGGVDEIKLTVLDGQTGPVGLFGGAGNDKTNVTVNDNAYDPNNPETANNIVELFGGDGDDSTVFSGSNNGRVRVGMIEGNNDLTIGDKDAPSDGNNFRLYTGAGQNNVTLNNGSQNQFTFLGENPEGDDALDGSVTGNFTGDENTFNGFTGDTADNLTVKGNNSRFGVQQEDGNYTPFYLGAGDDTLNITGSGNRGAIDLGSTGDKDTLNISGKDQKLTVVTDKNDKINLEGDEKDWTKETVVDAEGGEYTVYRSTGGSVIVVQGEGQVLVGGEPVPEATLPEVDTSGSGRDGSTPGDPESTGDAPTVISAENVDSAEPVEIPVEDEAAAADAAEEAGTPGAGTAGTTSTTPTSSETAVEEEEEAPPAVAERNAESDRAALELLQSSMDSNYQSGEDKDAWEAGDIQAFMDNTELDPAIKKSLEAIMNNLDALASLDDGKVSGGLHGGEFDGIIDMLDAGLSLDQVIGAGREVESSGTGSQVQDYISQPKHEGTVRHQEGDSKQKAEIDAMQFLLDHAEEYAGEDGLYNSGELADVLKAMREQGLTAEADALDTMRKNLERLSNLDGIQADTLATGEIEKLQGLVEDGYKLDFLVDAGINLEKSEDGTSSFLYQ